MPREERPLGESSGRLQMVLRAAGMVAWEFDVVTRNVEFASGRDDFQTPFYLDARLFAAELLEHAIHKEGPYRNEFRVVKPDGTVIWIRNQGEVVRDAEGRPIRIVGVAQDVTERKETDELLHRITEGVSVATGEQFLQLLAQHLCKALKTDYACIGELVDETRDRVRTVSYYAIDRFVDDVEYQLAGTPCEKALSAGRCSYPHGVQSFFPQDHLLVEAGINSYLGVALTGSSGEPLGVMAVMHRSPLNNIHIAETILNIFAMRASAELERRRWERALRESEIRNRAILGALPDVILVMDRRGYILESYAKDPSELGLPSKSPSGNRLDTVLTPEAAKLILQSAPTLEGREPAVLEHSLPLLGQPNFFEFRTIRFGDDKFLTIIRDITRRRRVEEDLKESRRFTQRMAETIPNVLFLYDLIERRNVYTNERSTDVIGYTPKEIEDMGDQFIPRVMHPDDLAKLPQLGQEYASRRDGEIFDHVFRMKHKNGEWRWVHRSATVFNRTPDGRPRQILGAVTDITIFKRAEQELQELSARLLHIQDEERRRIARELHDVTGQNLAAISLHLSFLEQSDTLAVNLRSTVAACMTLCRDSAKDIRTLSYLLFPPMLDQRGLVGTLKWYVDGFVKRAGIRVGLDIKPEIGRLPVQLETDLFRVVQEGLTNIMRHSGSKTATIRLGIQDERLILQIEDSGRGIPTKSGWEKPGQDKELGVGIPGMHERLRQHGGSLNIRSSDQGTTLTAVIPLASIHSASPALEKRAAEP